MIENSVISETSDSLMSLVSPEAAIALLASEIGKVFGESVLVLDDARCVVMANSRAEHMFGATPGALARQKLEQLIPEGGALEQSKKAFSGEVSVPVLARRLDGHIFPALAHLYQFQEPSAWLGFGLLDLTDEGVKQSGVMSARSLAGTLLRHLGLGIVIQSTGGVIIEANLSAEKILGLTRDQLIGRTLVDPRWRALRHDGSAFPAAEHPAVRALRCGGVQGDLMGLHKADGKLTWIQLEAGRLIEAENTPVYSAFMDVTEVVCAKQQAETALRRYEAMSSLSSEAVLILDAHLVIRTVSNNAARLLGCSEADLLEKPLSNWLEDAQVADIKAALSALLAYPGARGRRDINLRLSSGHFRSFDCSSINLLTDEMVGGILINLRDIHDQRVAEAALRRANDELEHRLSELSADRALDAGLSRVADLLQQCSTPEEAYDVLWASLPRLIPGFHIALYFEDEDHVEFIRHPAPPGDSMVFLPLDACWALRTRRAHISDGIVKLRCDHLDPATSTGHTACLPLMAAGRAVGLVVMTSTSPNRPLPLKEELNRLAVRLSIVVGNSRLKQNALGRGIQKVCTPVAEEWTPKSPD